MLLPKKCIRGLTRVAATEWAKDGINVNIICPLAWTSQLEQFKNTYPHAFKKNVHTPPAGHFGDAELENRSCSVQLANPDFKYMTGETLTLEVRPRSASLKINKTILFIIKTYHFN